MKPLKETIFLYWKYMDSYEIGIDVVRPMRQYWDNFGLCQEVRHIIYIT